MRSLRWCSPMIVRGAVPAFSPILASLSSSKSGGREARIAATSAAEKRPGRISRPSRRKTSSCSSLSFNGPPRRPLRVPGERGAGLSRQRQGEAPNPVADRDSLFGGCGRDGPAALGQCDLVRRAVIGAVLHDHKQVVGVLHDGDVLVGSPSTSSRSARYPSLTMPTLSPISSPPHLVAPISASAGE